MGGASSDQVAPVQVAHPAAIAAMWPVSYFTASYRDFYGIVWVQHGITCYNHGIFADPISWDMGPL